MGNHEETKGNRHVHAVVKNLIDKVIHRFGG